MSGTEDTPELVQPHQHGGTKIDPKLLEILVCPLTRTTLNMIRHARN